MSLFHVGQVRDSKVLTETLAANRTITAQELRKYDFFSIDPNGARDVTIPDASEFWNGESFILENTAGGAEVITLKDTTGSTICTPTQNETALVYCRAGAWKGIVGASN